MSNDDIRIDSENFEDKDNKILAEKLDRIAVKLNTLPCQEMRKKVTKHEKYINQNQAKNKQQKNNTKQKIQKNQAKYTLLGVIISNIIAISSLVLSTI